MRFCLIALALSLLVPMLTTSCGPKFKNEAELEAYMKAEEEKSLKKLSDNPSEKDVIKEYERLEKLEKKFRKQLPPPQEKTTVNAAAKEKAAEPQGYYSVFYNAFKDNCFFDDAAAAKIFAQAFAEEFDAIEGLDERMVRGIAKKTAETLLLQSIQDGVDYSIVPKEQLEKLAKTLAQGLAMSASR